MCSDAGLSLDGVAQALHVTTRTVRYWFSGRTSVPYAAYRLVRILGRFELPDPAWKGWLMHSGRLWSPEGHGFVPTDSNWWGLLCTRARLWTEQYQRGRQFDMLMLRTGAAVPAAAGGRAETADQVGRDYAGLEARARADLVKQAGGQDPGQAVGSGQLIAPSAPDPVALPPCSNRGGKSKVGSQADANGIQLQPQGVS
jgi:hypothetical protein